MRKKIFNESQLNIVMGTFLKIEMPYYLVEVKGEVFKCPPRRGKLKLYHFNKWLIRGDKVFLNKLQNDDGKIGYIILWNYSSYIFEIEKVDEINLDNIDLNKIFPKDLTEKVYQRLTVTGLLNIEQNKLLSQANNNSLASKFGKRMNEFYSYYDGIGTYFNSFQFYLDNDFNFNRIHKYTYQYKKKKWSFNTFYALFEIEELLTNSTYQKIEQEYKMLPIGSIIMGRCIKCNAKK